MYHKNDLLQNLVTVGTYAIISDLTYRPKTKFKNVVISIVKRVHEKQIGYYKVIFANKKSWKFRGSPPDNIKKIPWYHT